MQMVNNRYALVETLFSNNMGNLYRAHDRYPLLGQVDVLLHFLPSHTFRPASMSQMLDRQQEKSRQVDLPLLEVLDGGSAGGEVYFVMRVPKSWTLSVLPVVRGKPTRLHLQAQAMTTELVSKGVVRDGLEPQLFLVSPDGKLYLLGTALIPELQSLQLGSRTLLMAGSRQARSARVFPLLLLCSTGALAAAGYGLYQGSGGDGAVPGKDAPAVSMLDKVAVEGSHHGDVPGRALDAPLVAPVAAMPQPLPPVPAPVPLVANEITDTPEIRGLLQRVERAMEKGHLQAALYSLRLLQRRRPDHPQLGRLANRIAAGYRANAGGDHSGLSERMADDLVREFALGQTLTGEK